MIKMFLLLPFAFSIFAMCIALYVHWKLEKETKTKHVFALHVVNILVMMMIYGAAFISSRLTFVDYQHAANIGVKSMFFESTLFPLPLLIIIYAVSACVFRKYVKSYVKEDNSNVVYLRFNWFNRLMRK